MFVFSYHFGRSVHQSGLAHEFLNKLEEHVLNDRHTRKVEHRLHLVNVQPGPNTWNSELFGKVVANSTTNLR